MRGQMSGEQADSPLASWAELDKGVRRKLAQTAVLQEDISLVKSCLFELKQIASCLGQGWAVRPFGSIANGFAKRGSDLDATLFKDHTFPAADGDPEPSSSELLERVVALLQGKADIEIVEEVKGARIPILRMKYGGVLDVDLSFQNTEPLPNTQLLRSYAFISPVIRDLVVLVKIWAKGAGVCGAPQGHLSAYACTLMVLYFLQVSPVTRLPVLPAAHFGGEPGVPDVARQVTWRCPKPLPELLRGFFQFFAQDFQWGTEVVSVRTGHRALASEEVYSELRGRFSVRVHIEDPFLLKRNLHCTLRQELEQDLYHKIWEAFQLLQEGGLPPELCSPELPTARNGSHQAEDGRRPAGQGDYNKEALMPKYSQSRSQGYPGAAVGAAVPGGSGADKVGFAGGVMVLPGQGSYGAGGHSGAGGSGIAVKAAKNKQAPAEGKTSKPLPPAPAGPAPEHVPMTSLVSRWNF
mmetsp:Transcript_154972/g.496682  ORF Transcript_154972/g.496682 Transcript_154972/m.496682 type:complete len:466 (-) Transcript_154972:673-2070(-)